jgi:uncharacterized membrane protein YdfJ with MMPL/SSD domain
MAFAVAFGVLLDTLLVRSLLVPALTVDVGRVVWWPGRLASAGNGGGKGLVDGAVVEMEATVSQHER